jgi:phosphoglycolate phosphatase-like HAD superfamily hydrolase
MGVDPRREHWWWRDAPRSSGRAVIFDVDGVLADAQGRQHHLEWERRDWDAFFDACGDDAVIEEIETLLSLLDPTLLVLLVTARPQRVRDLTLSWLDHHELRWDLLVMRPTREYSPAVVFKRDVVDELRDAGYELELALEDDPRNRAMYVNEGIPCLYVHSGYYD